MEIDGRRVEWVQCNICSSESTDLLWAKDGFQYVKCKRCGLVYVNPRLTEDEIRRIDEEGFTSRCDTHPEPLDFQSYRGFFSRIDKYRLTNRLLDVGCFKGHLLVGARQHGWDVFGTEISESAAQYARMSYGLKVHCGPLHDAAYGSDTLDVVSLFDVIEHPSDPFAYLREIRRILRPGGLLHITTPNFNGVMRTILGKRWTVFFPWHLYYFSYQTLEKLLINSGLETIFASSSNWGPISTFNPYISLKEKRTISRGGLAQSEFVRRHKRILKKIFLFERSVENLPLKFLSAAGLFLGSKLVVYAEKGG